MNVDVCFYKCQDALWIFIFFYFSHSFEAYIVMKSGSLHNLNSILLCRYKLLGSLLVIFSFPVLESWISTLLQRPIGSNLIQYGSFLILMFAIFSTFKNKKHELIYLLSPSWIGLGTFILMILIHGLADFLFVKSIYWISYIAALASLLWALGGAKLFLRGLPFFLFSTFLLPVVNAEIQGAISLPLQLSSSWLAANFAGLFIPLTYNQNMLFVRNETLEITADCSGLQSWIGFIFGGVIRQLFEGAQVLELALLLPFSLILALLLNGIRLCLTTLVAYYFSADQAIEIHTNLDYALLPIGFFILWESGNWLKIKMKFPSVKLSSPESIPTARKTNTIFLITFFLIFFTCIGHYILNKPLKTVPEYPLKIAMKLDRWQGSNDPLSEAEMQSLAGATIINREYQRDDGRFLWLTVLESPSAQYVHNFWGCLIGQGIQPKVVNRVVMNLKGRKFNVPVVQYQYHDKVYYQIIWYQWDTGITANRWAWYKAVLESRLHHRTYNWKVVTITLPASQKTSNENYGIINQFSKLVFLSLI